MYELTQFQQIPCTLDEAWDFFCDPANLGKLTPEEMGFEKMDDNKRFYEGMLIRYKVSPFKGLRLNWTSEITKIANKKYFIDVQVEGPYKYWHHEHRFEESENGVTVVDRLHYQLPWGGLGALFHHSIVKKKLEFLFSYRKKRVEELFGS